MQAIQQENKHRVPQALNSSFICGSRWIFETGCA